MAPRLRIGILHPDLGIGGAERLIVDAALGLQKSGYNVEIFTSHHDPSHCFEETKDGSLTVKHIPSPFPRSFLGRFHILFAILSQLHLVFKLFTGARLSDSSHIDICDVYMVDQLSACVPLLRWGLGRRVVFYCHFPDKLLADGKAAPSDGITQGSLLKKLYRLPADWLEETTTRQADVILANSKFTAGIFEKAFPSIPVTPRVVYPGINIDAYTTLPDKTKDFDDLSVLSEIIKSPTLLSLNRFERKKNHDLAIRAFAAFRSSRTVEEAQHWPGKVRLVIGGGYDDRVPENQITLRQLQDVCSSLDLTFHTLTHTPTNPSHDEISTFAQTDVTFLLNFTTPQRTALLRSSSTIALLYTPTNEHFGIGPVEGMICGLPVLACESGGPVESIVQWSSSSNSGTGWLRPPLEPAWVDALHTIASLTPSQRATLSEAAQERARSLFGMDAMCAGLEGVLLEAAKMGAIWQGGKESKAFQVGNVLITVVAVVTAAAVYYGYL